MAWRMVSQERGGETRNQHLRAQEQRGTPSRTDREHDRKERPSGNEKEAGTRKNRDGQRKEEEGKANG